MRQAGSYDEATDDFYFDPRGVLQMYLPAPELRYYGEIVVLVGPNCASACEYFSDFMTREGRATVIGHYPSAGMGAGQKRFLMPGGLSLQFSAARYIDFDGNIIVEGIGVRPNLRVPVNEANTLAAIRGEDPILETALAYLANPDDFTLVQHEPVADPDALPDTSLPDAPAPSISFRDEDEAPQELQVGDLIIEAIRPGQRIRYSLAIAASQQISLYATSAQVDPVLRLYSAGGALLGENDNISADSLDAALLDISFPMDYAIIVEVGTRDDAGNGQFTLRVKGE